MDILNAKLIKTKHGKFLGIDKSTGKIKLCDGYAFDEWLLYEDRKLLNQSGTPMCYIDDNFILYTEEDSLEHPQKITIHPLDSGFGIQSNSFFLSDRKGRYLQWAETLQAWEIFIPI